MTLNIPGGQNYLDLNETVAQNNCEKREFTVQGVIASIFGENSSIVISVSPPPRPTIPSGSIVISVSPSPRPTIPSASSNGVPTVIIICAGDSLFAVSVGLN